jgi:hypothetical protein
MNHSFQHLPGVQHLGDLDSPNETVIHSADLHMAPGAGMLSEQRLEQEPADLRAAMVCAITQRKV